MKTTVDIPDGMLQELLGHTRAATRREAMLAAVAEFNRRRMVELTPNLGTSREPARGGELGGLREDG